MKKERKFSGIIAAVGNFLVFFVLVAFVITCCLLLFITILQETIGSKFTAEEITAAAKATMTNVIVISLVFAACDALRRKLTVERPVEQIIGAAEKMIAGDFSVRIKPVAKFAVDGRFNDIIECINTMASELSSVETLRTDFVANVSHEMKTPLSVMQNYSRLLSAPKITDEERIEYATAINDASRRLADMMTNILKLNRLENQKIYPKAESYNLGEQLCESLLQFESEWEKKSIEIDTGIEEDVFISADRELLSLVWNNILSNAFKFTEPYGRVSLNLSCDEKHAIVEISDTGCGMSKEVGAHIFEKFYQGDSSRATQGNGLGLALVKRVVDIIGAEISVKSSLGEGTAFTVKIRRSKNGPEENR